VTDRSADAPAAQPIEHAQLGDYMTEHFTIITWARDSIINGELEALREPLRGFAVYEYRDLEPGVWIPFIARIQQSALLGAEAGSLRSAAAAVATMAVQCGDCHRHTAQAPLSDDLPPFRASEGPESFAMRMRRHGWAADRMWEGLAMPSERAWFQGASALANGPSELPETSRPLTPRVASALIAMRLLGTQALDAEHSEARIDVYADLLAACASCHQPSEDL
jgi:cytochrome c553